MFGVFEFDLPGTVARQVEEQLESMPGTALGKSALLELADLQAKRKLQHGVYQVLLQNQVAYVWKAADPRKQLAQHYSKLTGRDNIKLANVRFRCLLMHANWCAIIDERLLINRYKAKGLAKWNGAGFGPKDVGRGRDGTQPSWFDQHYPINADYPCEQIEDQTTVGALAGALKSQLPFTFRYEVLPAAVIHRAVNLKRVPRQARALIQALVTALGEGWQATLFGSHVILYEEQRSYPFGEAILPASRGPQA